MTSVLELRDVDVKYGPAQVLFGVDMTVEEGEILALLGTNGAGKSTIFRAVCGLADVSNGTVHLDGVDITKVKPSRTQAMGISQVPGGRGVFPTLTVRENLKAASWAMRGDKTRAKRAVEKALDTFPKLVERLDTAAGAMSGGEQQMLSLAQAFIHTPRLLLIDELSLGLAPTIVDDLLQTVRDIRAQGSTIVVIEQSVTTALRIADRAVFLEKGEVRFTGPTEELTERKDLLRSVYLKGTSGITVREPTTDALRRDERATVLEVRDLVKRYGGVTATDHVSFDVVENEIVGLIGPNGAGKTTIMDLVSGLQDLDGGQIFLHGEDVTDVGPHGRARRGLGRTFQDAQLFASMTVAEALLTSLEQDHPAPDLLPAAFGLRTATEAEGRLSVRADELVELVGLGSFRDKFISELSTGSRRIVEIACLVAQRPSVLLLDEPSSGVAQKEAEAMGTALQAVRHHLGASIVIIEHSMPLLTAMADRLVALETGAVVTIGGVDEVLDHPRVIKSYLGGDVDDLPSDPTPVAEAGGGPVRTSRRRSPLRAGS